MSCLVLSYGPEAGRSLPPTIRHHMNSDLTALQPAPAHSHCPPLGLKVELIRHLQLKFARVNSQLCFAGHGESLLQQDCLTERLCIKFTRHRLPLYHVSHQTVRRRAEQRGFKESLVRMLTRDLQHVDS